MTDTIVYSTIPSSPRSSSVALNVDMTDPTVVFSCTVRLGNTAAASGTGLTQTGANSFRGKT